ncbi:hypothetical protein AVEN_211961-1 [Araneus ventricosus]|uniref:Uncharacterized protein n=1 Tax=Araneus ventricosus TaxID=182803 RepID=A0A4Y2FWM7_ARAVE|nr:hypothetical protein AVEN_211961-1 [Araneus ventricosus]
MLTALIYLSPNRLLDRSTRHSVSSMRRSCRLRHPVYDDYTNEEKTIRRSRTPCVMPLLIDDEENVMDRYHTSYATAVLGRSTCGNLIGSLFHFDTDSVEDDSFLYIQANTTLVSPKP